MRTGKRGDDFGQCTQVKVNQAADGMVVMENVALSSQRAEAAGTVHGISPRTQSPAI